MAVSKIVSPEFVVEEKDLTQISAKYLRGNVSKAGYTPVGIIQIDGTGIASTNAIRLFYITGVTAQVGFIEAPTTGSSVQAKILYQRD